MLKRRFSRVNLGVYINGIDDNIMRKLLRIADDAKLYKAFIHTKCRNTTYQINKNSKLNKPKNKYKITQYDDQYDQSPREFLKCSNIQSLILLLLEIW